MQLCCHWFLFRTIFRLDLLSTALFNSRTDSVEFNYSLFCLLRSVIAYSDLFVFLERCSLLVSPNPLLRDVPLTLTLSIQELGLRLMHLSDEDQLQFWLYDLGFHHCPCGTVVWNSTGTCMYLMSVGPITCCVLLSFLNGHVVLIVTGNYFF